MTTAQTTADLYLRLSDFRADDEGSFPARQAKLEAKAAGLGWAVHRVVIENDVRPDGGRKPASAWKRVYTGRKTENGRKIYRVERDGWRGVIRDLETGAANAVLAEDLDRTCRDMADLLDLLDAIGACKGNARSLSGSLTLTDGGTSSERTTAKIMVSVAEKSSDDTSRRVADGRERWAGKSYQGGRRPYGYQVAPDTEQYHRTLIMDQAEATVIRAAAAAILAPGEDKTSLKAAARDLRDRRVPTVTGAAWTASTLRDVLAKPAVAGLSVHNGELREAPWDAILDRDVWDQLRDLFDGRANPGTSNAPRWLVSCYATCGAKPCPDGALKDCPTGETGTHKHPVCGGPVKCTGTSNRRAYTCRDHGHVRRNAVEVDKCVSGAVVKRLSLPDAADLLKPPPRPDMDVKKLKAQAKKLNVKRDDLARLLTEEVLTEAGVRAERKRIDAQLAKITAELEASNEADPLPEFRAEPGKPAKPADAVWESLTLPRKRAVVRLLVTVTILPAGRNGRDFDPNTIRIEWNREDTPEIPQHGVPT